MAVSAKHLLCGWCENIPYPKVFTTECGMRLCEECRTNGICLGCHNVPLCSHSDKDNMGRKQIEKLIVRCGSPEKAEDWCKKQPDNIGKQDIIERPQPENLDPISRCRYLLNGDITDADQLENVAVEVQQIMQKWAVEVQARLDKEHANQDALVQQKLQLQEELSTQQELYRQQEDQIQELLAQLYIKKDED